MKEDITYADQWDISSKYFYDKKYYHWMCDKLQGYNTILEIGCGTGYSTLSLLERGHRVIAIDKNIECINKAKRLLSNSSNIEFITSDIVNESFYTDILPNLQFDVVICWNIGTSWCKDTLSFYLPYLLAYGLNINQIKSNPESSYSELVLWNAFKIAKMRNTALHIVDRSGEMINCNNDPYYHLLKKEFSFKAINYDNLQADTISNGGRILTVDGIPNNEKIMKIVLASILLK